VKQSLAVVACLLLASCGVDQKKFDGAYRAGKAVQAAVNSGVNMTRYSELLQVLTTETSIAKDHEKGSAEKKLVEAYESAATSYGHALVLWHLKVEGPTDWIDMGPTLDKMLAPYTDIKFDQSVPGSKRVFIELAMQAIWKVASSKLDAANALLTGH